METRLINSFYLVLIFELQFHVNLNFPLSVKRLTLLTFICCRLWFAGNVISFGLFLSPARVEYLFLVMNHSSSSIPITILLTNFTYIFLTCKRWNYICLHINGSLGKFHFYQVYIYDDDLNCLQVNVLWDYQEKIHGRVQSRSILSNCDKLHVMGLLRPSFCSPQ